MQHSPLTTREASPRAATGWNLAAEIGTGVRIRPDHNRHTGTITGHTDAELVTARVDTDEPNMGLTTWNGVRVRMADVTVAKNYLAEDEMTDLNRIVTIYMDYAEDQTRRHQPMYMRDWADKLDGFLQFNERDVLDNPGTVSSELAEHLAHEQYERFHARRLAAADADSMGELDQTGSELAGMERDDG